MCWMTWEEKYGLHDLLKILSDPRRPDQRELCARYQRADNFFLGKAHAKHADVFDSVRFANLLRADRQRDRIEVI